MSGYWDSIALGEIAEIQQGRTLAVKDMTGGPHPVFGANGVIGHFTHGTYGFETVALGCRGSCGTVHIAPAGAYLANNVMAIWPKDPEVLCLGFLALALERADLVTSGVISGQVQPQITRKSLQGLRLWIPDLDAQRRIVDLTAHFDAHLERLLDEVAALELVLKSLGDDQWLAESPTRALSELCGAIVTGTTPSTKKDMYWLPPEVPFVTPGDLGASLIVQGAERRLSRTGASVARIIGKYSVMVGCIGTIGKVGITSTECVTNQQINSLVGMDETEAVFLGVILACSRGQQALQSQAGQTTVPILNKSQFSRIQVPWPTGDVRASVGATAVSVINHLDDLNSEVKAIRDLRLRVLDALLSQDMALDSDYQVLQGEV